MSATPSPAPVPVSGDRAGTPSPTSQPARLVVRTVRLGTVPGGPSALVDLLPDTRPLSWVRHGDGMVGWGEVLRLETSGPGRFADADAAWRALLERATVDDEVALPGTGPVAFGSFAFDDVGPDGDPDGAPGVLVVPQVVVGRRGDVGWMTTIGLAPTPGVSQDGSQDTASEDSQDGPGDAALAAVRRAPVSGPGRVSVTDGSVASADWPRIVAEGVDRIRAGALEKVVLARDVVATAEHPVDPRFLLGRLAQGYPTCWTFSVAGMVGATPELLVRSEQGRVSSRVLAGTARRSPTTGAGHPQADRDADHDAELLARSVKDLEEHEFAVRSVTDALGPFCASLDVPEAPFVLRLPNVMHLASDVSGVLDPAARAGSLTLAAALHPSAAVGGTPTAAARVLIREIEHLDRARYAGPVGWVGADGDGEWGIALRSAELGDDPHRLRLFAGCGIVAASDPAAELAESEAKLVPMRWALGAD